MNRPTGPGLLRRTAERLPLLVPRRQPQGWFDMEQIDPQAFAIHERRYWQRNVS